MDPEAVSLLLFFTPASLQFLINPFKNLQSVSFNHANNELGFLTGC